MVLGSTHRGTKRLRDEDAQVDGVVAMTVAPEAVAPQAGADWQYDPVAQQAGAVARHHVLICGVEYTTLQWYLGKFQLQKK